LRFKQETVSRKVHDNTIASQDEKDKFKKKLPKYLWMNSNNNKLYSLIHNSLLQVYKKIKPVNHMF
jgi:hypothetical protein